MIGIPLGLAVANATEWAFHKYVLHGLGKDPDSFWAYHWHEHHRNASRKDYRDPDYERSVFGWHAQGKEASALLVGALSQLPLLPIAPWYTATIWYSAWRYYRVHKRSHQQPEWGKKRAPWHYDHHMARDQEQNWCITRPWMDQLMGTRVPYLDTPQHAQDEERRRRIRELL